MLLYRLVWWPLTPLLMAASALHPRLRGAWRQRWTLALPAVEPGAVVVHGASVGEGRAAEALLLALRRRSPRRVLLRSAFTDTGLESARGHDALCALPFDAPWAVRRWLDRLRPRALVLVESELWPNLLAAAAARGVPVVVVGARVGRGTARLRRLAPGLWASMEGAVGAWFAKDEAGAAALRPLVSGAVEVGGEPKEDAPPPPVGLRFDRPLLVAGSTRPGEEAALLDARPPGAALLLAPRHRERFDEVAALLEGRGERWARRSALADGPVDPALDVVLLDTVGELAGYYPQARAAFVGGTFLEAVGGHSPAEAARAGIPVVRGPWFSANAAAWEGARVFPAEDLGGLGEALAAALAEGPGAPASAGAAGRLAERLEGLLEAPIPPERSPRPLLWPLAWLWLALGWLRLRLVRPRRAPLPVISVGNLASGGTGKTPAAAWILGALEQLGRRPAALSRGYGREPAGPALRTAGRPGDPPPDGGWLGDEPAQLARAGRLVISCPDRLVGARAAAGAGADVAVLDDGFQHRRLARDLDVVVIDAARPLSGGPIPAGEAREGPGALARADVLWVNHGPPPQALLGRLRPGALVVEARFVPVGWLRAGGCGRPPEALPLAALGPGPVSAVAGVARPGRFLETLVALGFQVQRWHAFPDHHRFSPAELAALRALPGPLVTTEKDLARLPPDLEAWALRIQCELVQGEAELRRRLAEVTGA
jgi:tetraacyldisaccharide 4'-kinase